MIDKNNLLTIAIAGGKEGHHRGIINELKSSVEKHKNELTKSLNLMLDESIKEVEKIDQDETFSVPENLENLDKDRENEVIDK